MKKVKLGQVRRARSFEDALSHCCPLRDEMKLYASEDDFIRESSQKKLNYLNKRLKNKKRPVYPALMSGGLPSPAHEENMVAQTQKKRK